MTLCSLDEALEDLTSGKFVIVVDDEGRENEGDLFLLAQYATPEAVNFMVTHARGLVCIPLSSERLDELRIAYVAQPQLAIFSAHCVHHFRGLQAWHIHRHIRLRPQRHDPGAYRLDSQPEDFIHPGHMFPLRADPAGC